MNTVFKRLLVTAEKASSFEPACQFAEYFSELDKPEEVDFLFVNDDLSQLNHQTQEKIKNCMIWMQNHHIGTEHNFRHGNFHRGTLEMVRLSHSDLIICGAEQVSGFRRFWNGSETYKLIKSAPCFVVSLQQPMRKNYIRKIVVPIDSTGESTLKMPAAAHFAKLFGATVHLLGVSSSSSTDAKNNLKKNVNEAVVFFSEKHIDVDVHNLFGSNLTDLTLFHADEVEADMIMMMAMEEPNPYGVFEGSYPEQMILKSKLPVVAIRPQSELEITYHF